MHRIAGCVAVLSLMVASQVRAQIPVTDAGNLTQNIISAVQAVATTANTAATVKNQLLELLPLDAILIAQGMADDLSELAAIVEDASALSADITQLTRQIHDLFGLDNTPTTVEALQVRMRAMQTMMYEVRRYAVCVQALGLTLRNTVKHLSALVGHIGSLRGNLAAQQLATQLQGQTAHTLAIIEVQQAAWQRQDTLERMEKAVILRSIARIECERLGSWKPAGGCDGQ